MWVEDIKKTRGWTNNRGTKQVDQSLYILKCMYVQP